MMYYNFPRFMFDDVREMRHLRGRLNELFNELFAQEAQQADVAVQIPYDLVEEKDRYLLMFEIPGVKKEDVKLSVHDGQLVVSGERKEPNLGDKVFWVRKEIFRGKFKRSVELPEGADVGKISAEYRDGILLVNIPKKVEAQEKEIQINIE